MLNPGYSQDAGVENGYEVKRSGSSTRGCHFFLLLYVVVTRGRGCLAKQLDIAAGGSTMATWVSTMGRKIG